IMQRIIIFGNSGSGKSTLALQYATAKALPLLDLDTLAWLDSDPPQRRKLEDSARDIESFTGANPFWIIEGCYADLLGLVIDLATDVVFLNPGVETCLKNCKSRPWEPHKYATIEKQDQNLEMLLQWVKQYPQRTDDFSLTSHQRLFSNFNGKKTEFNSNARN
ncbi:MAG: shikimate kinase, partial [Thiohalomonadales bacterium]